MKGLNLYFGALALAVALSGVTAYADDTATQPATTDAATVETTGEDTPKVDTSVDSATTKPVKKAKAKRARQKAMKKKKSQKTEANAAPVSDSVATAAAANEPSEVAVAKAASDSAAAAPVSAPAAAPVQTSAADSASLSPLKRMSASYTMWITGPTVADIDGKAGDGNNMTLDQFASVGYKVSSKWKVSGTAFWTNKVRSDSEGKKNLTWNNPYITASNSSFTKSTKYGTNLSAYVRYYLPLSHASADNVGKRVDTKNGVVRLFIGPSKSFLDGKLVLTGDTYIHRSFAGARPSPGVGEQRDWRIYLYPHLTYNWTDKFDTYVAYFNDWEHVRLDATRQGGGRWQSFNDKHSLEIGLNWSPIKNLTLSPYLSYGPTFVPRNSDVGFIAEYAFL